LTKSGVIIAALALMTSCTEYAEEPQPAPDLPVRTYRVLNEDVDGQQQAHQHSTGRTQSVTTFCQDFSNPQQIEDDCNFAIQPDGDTTIRYEDGVMKLDNEFGPGIDGSLAVWRTSRFNVLDEDTLQFKAVGEDSRYQISVYLETIEGLTRLDTLDIDDGETINYQHVFDGDAFNLAGGIYIRLNIWVDEGDEGFVDDFKIKSINPLVADKLCSTLPITISRQRVYNDVDRDGIPHKVFTWTSVNVNQSAWQIVQYFDEDLSEWIELDRFPSQPEGEEQTFIFREYFSK
jgi:hypothetical protein